MIAAGSLPTRKACKRLTHGIETAKQSITSLPSTATMNDWVTACASYFTPALCQAVGTQLRWQPLGATGLSRLNQIKSRRNHGSKAVMSCSLTRLETPTLLHMAAIKQWLQTEPSCTNPPHVLPGIAYDFAKSQHSRDTQSRMCLPWWRGRGQQSLLWG